MKIAVVVSIPSLHERIRAAAEGYIKHHRIFTKINKGPRNKKTMHLIGDYTAVLTTFKNGYLY